MIPPIVEFTPEVPPEEPVAVVKAVKKPKAPRAVISAAKKAKAPRRKEKKAS